MKAREFIFENHLMENVSNFVSAGIPKQFAEKFLKTYNVRHDTEIKTIGKPKANDFEDGDFIINVLSNGDVVAAGVYKQYRGNYWYRMVMKDGEAPNIEYPNNSKEAIKGMSTRGEFHKVGAGGWSAGHPGKERGEKPTADEIERRKDSEDALAGGADAIYEYMNKTFMPKMKQQMEAMVDDIYANLRKLDRNLNQWGTQRSYISRNQKEVAIDAASAIEEIAKQGFTRSTMEEFLKTFGKLHTSYASIPKNEKELQRLLKSEPNARAKWAKIVLRMAKDHHNTVKIGRAHV
jgi:ribonuclease HII